MKVILHALWILFAVGLFYSYLLFHDETSIARSMETSNLANGKLIQATCFLLVKILKLFHLKETDENTKSILLSKIIDVEKYVMAKKNEKVAKMGMEIVSEYSTILSPEQKHQLGTFMMLSTRKKDALALVDVEKLNEQQLQNLVWHFSAAWDSRTVSLPIGAPAQQLCRMLRKYVLEINQTIPVIQNAGFYCYRYGMKQDVIQIYEKGMETVGNETLMQVTTYEKFRAFKGITKFHTGDPSGNEDVLIACKNLLSYIPKQSLNPKGKNAPYSIQYLDRLHDYPNRTIYHKTSEKLIVDCPIPPDSGLGLPQILELEDRDVMLVEISNVTQVLFGLYLNRNNDFIMYDSGHFSIADKFLIQAEYNLSSFTRQTLEEAVFTCVYFGNYYHWLIEGMARLVYLFDTGFFLYHPNAVVPIINFKDTGRVLECLTLINFPLQKVHLIDFVPEGVTHYKTLYTPVFVPWDNPDLQLINPTQMHLPPPHLLRVLNKYLNPNPLPLAQRTKIIYVGRPDAASRRSPFDSRLIVELKKHFHKDLLVFPEPAPSIIKQKEMFATARIIVGPHGAGISNIIFAAPNQTAVIVFPVKTIQFDPPFSNLAVSLGMYFWTLPNVSSHYATDYEDSDESFTYIVKAVQQASLFMQNLL